ncbi:hypothetical protein GEV33_007224 [Tenebrio molitor]|uniref:Uncharacterized protein n=1 Tax=Tenebrio molitor TaxID=7067 RepID=A0A8J6HJP4_TENMO|nr:hypothetical protein GEV33_007224 [Tenebrio molitor]
MDLVDGVDAVVAGGGDGFSLDCILEVTFSGGSALSAARRASSSGHARSALNTERRIPRGKSPSSNPSCRSDPRRSEEGIAWGTPDL